MNKSTRPPTQKQLQTHRSEAIKPGFRGTAPKPPRLPLGLPDRLASTLAAETDQRKVHVLLKTELTRELEALAHAIGSV